MHYNSLCRKPVHTEDPYDMRPLLHPIKCDSVIAKCGSICTCFVAFQALCIQLGLLEGTNDHNPLVQASLCIAKDSIKSAKPVLQQHALTVAFAWYDAGAGMLMSSALFRQASYDDVVEWIWSLGDISSGGMLQTSAP